MTAAVPAGLVVRHRPGLRGRASGHGVVTGDRDLNACKGGDRQTVLGYEPVFPIHGERPGRDVYVALTLADAAAYPFTPFADLAVSQFGVMFFGDPVQAFANIRKAKRRSPIIENYSERKA